MMRNLKATLSLGLLLIFFSFQSDNSKLEWYDWNEGYVKGMEKDKIILVDVYTDWCGWCKKMDKDTYAKEEVIEIIEKDFIPIKFNPEKPGTYKVDGHELNGKQLLSMLSQGKMSGYPTTFFLFPSERQLYIEGGYQDSKRFKTTLEKYVELKENGTSGDSSN